MLCSGILAVQRIQRCGVISVLALTFISFDLKQVIAYLLNKDSYICL